MNDKDIVQILYRNKTALEVAHGDDVRHLIADTERAIHWLEDEDRSVNCMICDVELTAKSIVFCVDCARRQLT